MTGKRVICPTRTTAHKANHTFAIGYCPLQSKPRATKEAVFYGIVLIEGVRAVFKMDTLV